MISKEKTNLLYTYDNPINWNLSGFGNEVHMYTIIEYIKLLNKFGVNKFISTINGSYISKYNGGRIAMYIQDPNKIYDKIREFNNLGVGVKLTFSYSNMNKDLFEDQELRGYLEVLSENKNVNNGIICSVDDFANFIHQKYPSIIVTSSYVKMAIETKLGLTDTVDYYNKLFNLYDIVVCNTSKAFDDNFLNNIKYIDRIEFIVNNSCNLNCQIACKHYDNMFDISQRVRYLDEHKIYKTDPKLELLRRESNKINDNCIFRKQKNDIDKLKYEFINRDEINELSNLGVKYFKLEGRDLDYAELKNNLFSYIINNQSIFWKYHILPQKEIIQEWMNRKLINNI